jgi:hypothetical protein
MDHRAATETFAADRYLLGEMSADEREAFEEHFFDCAQCAEEVRAGALLEDGVRGGLLVASVPARASRAWWPAIAAPWAVAATLAIVAGYEFVHTRSTVQPIVLAPTTLRPATRGDAAVVTLGPGGAVTLAVPLAGPGDGPVRYELFRGDARLAAGEAPAPLPGVPFLLMIPSGLLNRGDECLLRVKNVASADLTAEEYRFSVESR